MQGPTRSSFRVCDHFIYVHAMVCSFAVPKSHELLLIVRKSSKPGSARASSEVFARCCWNRPGLRWLHYFELLFPVRWVWFEKWVEVPAQNSGSSCSLPLVYIPGYWISFVWLSVTACGTYSFLTTRCHFVDDPQLPTSADCG